jgi:hypothetical protein
VEEWRRIQNSESRIQMKTQLNSDDWLLNSIFIIHLTSKTRARLSSTASEVRAFAQTWIT